MNSLDTFLAVSCAILVVVGAGILVVPYFRRKRKIDTQTKILIKLTNYNDHILAICTKTLNTLSSHPMAKELCDNPHVELVFQKCGDVGKIFKRIRGQILHLHPIHPQVRNYIVAINKAKFEFKDAELTLGIISNALNALVNDIAEHNPQPTAQQESYVFSLLQQTSQLTEGKGFANIANLKLDELEQVMQTLDYSKSN